MNDFLPAAEQALQTRACQVYWDIKTLLEKDRRRGALARWRTLYEIAAVRLHIGNNRILAERYVQYIHVVQLRGMKLYDELHEEWKEHLREWEERTGESHPPFTPQEIEAKTTEVGRLMARFGTAYGKFPWGWNKNKPVRKMVKGTELDPFYVGYELAHDEIHNKPHDPLVIPEPNFHIGHLSAVCLLLAAACRRLNGHELASFPDTLNIRDAEKRSVRHACEVGKGIVD